MFRLAVLLSFCFPITSFGQAKEIYDLLQQGRVSIKAGKLDDAEKQIQSAITLATKHFTMDHPNGSDMYFELGEIQMMRGDFRKASKEYSKALTIREKHLGKNHLSTANAADKLGVTLSNLDDFDRAEDLLLGSLAVREKLVDAKNNFLAISYQNIANMYWRAGRFAKAEQFYQKDLDFGEANFGKESVSVAISLNNLGKAQFEVRKLKEAQANLERSLQIVEVKVSKDDVSVNNLLSNLARVHRDLGNYDKAEALFQRALENAEKIKGKEDPATALCLNNLADLYDTIGSLERAEASSIRALAIHEKVRGKDHLDTAQNRMNLGMIYLNGGKYDLAQTSILQALRSAESRLGKEHVIVATMLNNLGVIYKEMQLPEKAEPLLERALVLREKLLGKNSPITAITLVNLADLYSKRKEHYTKAEEFYNRAIESYDASYGKDSIRSAIALNNLYRLKLDKDKQARLDILLRSYQIFEARLGPNHPDTIRIRTNVGYGYQRARDHEKAEPILRRNLTSLQKTLGVAHPSTLETEKMLVQSLFATNQSDETLKTMDSLRRHTRQFVTDVLPGLSQQDQTKFLKESDTLSLYRAFSVGLAFSTDERFTTASAAWLLNSKATLQEAAARSIQIAAAGDSPTAKQLLELRSALSRMSIGNRSRENEATARQQQTMIEREKQLLAELRASGGRAARSLPWVELADVRKQLPEKGVFIDIARFQVAPAAPKDGEMPLQAARYVAWITPKTGPIRLIDLGLAEPIEQAVVAARAEWTHAAKTISKLGEPGAEKRLRELMTGVAKLVLYPLLKEIGDRDYWTISPDSSLWLMPWAALPMPDGAYVVEKHTIRLVVSGRDLVAPPSAANIKLTQPLIVADPDFDLDSNEAVKEAKSLLNNLLPLGNDSRGLSVRLGLGHAQRLPGTAAEAEAIAPRVEAWLHTKPRILTERQALKSIVKSTRSPHLLILSTHGYFKPDQEAQLSEGADSANPNRSSLRTKDDKPFEDPLLRCGLLLAACNSRPKDNEEVVVEDGILTGLEVIGCDLRGTKLVVLSACETGLGDVKNGEGVAGLRQAFQLAGAESVLATLWQIPDLQSAQLMVAFFDNLANKQDRDEALRNAQREMIQRRRDRNNAAHPFYWAAYTLTGRVK